MPKEKLEQGVVESYIHSNKKIGVLLELKTKTDFASRTEIFKNLAHDLAMQIAAMGEKELESQTFIKNPEKKIRDILKEAREQLGEPVEIGRIARYAL